MGSIVFIEIGGPSKIFLLQVLFYFLGAEKIIPGGVNYEKVEEK